MIRAPIGRATGAILLLLGTGLTLNCTGSRETPSGPETPLLAAKAAAKPTGGPTVTTADPAYGHEGDVSKQVTITGSGFVAGAQASWERAGVPDPKIQVVSTQYVSSTQLTATITIAPDASLDFYDVSVTNPDRKKGIGYALFEVTQAVAISGTENAFGVNSNGQMTGRVGVPGAFYFSAASGLITLGGNGHGSDISEDGLAVVGGNTINASNGQAYIFTLSGGVWTETFLPKDPASCIATARTVASDPSTGAATLIGGVENGGCYSGSNLHRKPRVWAPNGSGWTRMILPGGTNTDDLLNSITPGGVAAGRANNQAAVWDPNGPGAWTLTFIGPQGSFLNGIDNTGNLAVGGTTAGSSTSAAYWIRSGSTWSGPLSLPAGCSSAADVDESGRIVANDCANGNRRTPAVILPPYGAGNVVFLGGLGDSRNASSAQGISAQGGWIVGQASLKNLGTGVYWNIQ
jgi:hypothetical protein